MVVKETVCIAVVMLCISPAGLSILSQGPVGPGGKGFTVTCSADSIDLPKEITMIKGVTLYRKKSGQKGTTELAALLPMVVAEMKDISWKRNRTEDGVEFRFPSETAMSTTLFDRKTLVLTATFQSPTCEDEGAVYTCVVDFASDGGSMVTRNKSAVLRFTETGYGIFLKIDPDNSDALTRIGYYEKGDFILVTCKIIIREDPLGFNWSQQTCDSEIDLSQIHMHTLKVNGKENTCRMKQAEQTMVFKMSQECTVSCLYGNETHGQSDTFQFRQAYNQSSSSGHTKGQETRLDKRPETGQSNSSSATPTSFISSCIMLSAPFVLVLGHVHMC